MEMSDFLSSMNPVICLYSQKVGLEFTYPERYQNIELNLPEVKKQQIIRKIHREYLSAAITGSPAAGKLSGGLSYSPGHPGPQAPERRECRRAA